MLHTHIEEPIVLVLAPWILHGVSRVRKHHVLFLQADEGHATQNCDVTHNAQGQMYRRRAVCVALELVGLSLNKAHNVARNDLRLHKPRPRGLVRARVRDVAYGKDVGECVVCDLERGSGGDESIGCYGAWGEGGKQRGLRGLAD